MEITGQYGGTSAPVQQEKELGAAEMKFRRSVTGCTLDDRKTNEEIRKELNMYDLSEIVLDYRYGRTPQHDAHTRSQAS